MFTNIVIGAAALITLFLLISVLRSPAQRKIGVANVSRRKWSSVLVIAGSMVGTALIVGSLVLGDTFDRFTQNAAFDYLGEVDIFTRNLDPETYQLLPITPAMVETVSRDALNDATDGKVDGVLSAVARELPVLKVERDPNAQLGFKPILAEPEVTVVGYDHTAIADFGSTPPPLSLLPEPGDAEAYVSTSLARELELTVGNDIVMFIDNQPTLFTVGRVLADEGLAGFRINIGSNTGTVVISLAAAQQLLGLAENDVNAILISNVGSVIEGRIPSHAVASSVTELLEDASPETLWLVYQVKDDTLAENEGGGSISDIFLMVSSFAILAGVMLIVNIYAMLGEERRTEMGIMRAVAFKRQQLVMTFAYEGFIYSAAASIIGAALGAALGAAIVAGVSEALAQDEALLIDGLPLTIKLSTLVFAGAAGLLISFITAFATSLRISRLNIVMAIRDLSEPSGERGSRWRLLWIPVALLLGALLTFVGASEDNGWFLYIGPSILLAVGAAAAGHLLPPRLVFTLGGIAIIAFSFLADRIDAVGDVIEDGPGLFLISGVFMLLAGMMIIAFNLSVILWVVGLGSRWLKHLEPIVRIAMAYPAVSRTRTALTMGMFGLVLYGVTLITMYTGLLDGFIDANLDEAAGGFDVVVYNTSTNPIVDLRAQLAASDDLDLSQITAIMPILRAQVKFPDFERAMPSGPDNSADDAPPEDRYVLDSIHGIDGAFAVEQSYALSERDPAYASDAAAWAAVASDPTLAIVSHQYDGTREFLGNALINPGDTVRLYNPTTTEIHEKTVIGRMEQVEFGLGVLWGVVVNADAFQQQFAESSYRGDAPRLFVMRLADGTDLIDIGSQLEKALITTGAPVRVVRQVLTAELQATSALFRILQGFLAFGLIVGIAGLAVIAARSVHQRRQGIGMLRALGFHPRMVLASLLIEWSFIAIVGIFLGVSLGFLGGYRLYELFVREAGGAFTVPWLELTAIVVIVYASSLAFTVLPAMRASRMAPVEALRYQD